MLVLPVTPMMAVDSKRTAQCSEGLVLVTVALVFVEFCLASKLAHKEVHHSDPAELHGAIAFAISGINEVADEQIKSNKQFVALSNGMLAPVLGGERLLSVGCGHMAGACRAARHQCRTVGGLIPE